MIHYVEDITIALPSHTFPPMTIYSYPIMPSQVFLSCVPRCSYLVPPQVFLPLPGIAAEQAGLDIAPVPGDIYKWIPEQSKVKGGGARGTLWGLGQP